MTLPRNDYARKTPEDKANVARRKELSSIWLSMFFGKCEKKKLYKALNIVEDGNNNRNT